MKESIKTGAMTATEITVRSMEEEKYLSIKSVQIADLQAKIVTLTFRLDSALDRETHAVRWAKTDREKLKAVLARESYLVRRFREFQKDIDELAEQCRLIPDYQFPRVKYLACNSAPISDWIIDIQNEADQLLRASRPHLIGRYLYDADGNWILGEKE